MKEEVWHVLRKPQYQFFTNGEIKPEGWLKRQLQIQANGLSGNLDKVWPDVRDSKWVGGDRDGWERVPYWLDGFIPLAYLLEDDDLIDRATQYVDGILARQSADGWLCPCSIEERRSYDLWSGILIAKVLAMYADLSGDTRIEGAIYRFMENLNVFTRHTTIHNWASLRWFEMLIPIYWLYERRPEEWLLRLAIRFEQQGFDYEKLFSPYRDQKPERVWTYSTHVVNLAMAIKQGALISRLHGGDSEAFAIKMLKDLFQYHGMAAGHFTGDECVMGDSPVQGSELCGVVEAMYSYEHLLSISGNPEWGDMLERLAFNALPASLSHDMWTHQYDQQTNQICCARLPEDHVIFGTNGPESHLFGLEPNFGCCTANFNQGWPKFAMSTFMRSDEGIVSAALAPASVTTQIAGHQVTCRLETEYPFREALEYTIITDAPVEFELRIRIPGFVRSALVDGVPATPGSFCTIRRTWNGEQKVDVQFKLECSLEKRPRDMRALWRGPLLYSVAIRERWEMLEYTRHDVERRFPYCDYEVYPESAWNFGFAAESFDIVRNPMSEYPFGSEPAAIEIIASLAPIDWPEAHGVCLPEPNSRMPIDEARPMRMIPYGAAKLRMTEMPMVTK